MIESSIEDIMQHFLNDKFKEVIEVVSFHKPHLDEELLQKMPDINYVGLYRFFESAVTNLTGKDASIKDTVFVKLFVEIKAFSEFYASITKQLKENSDTLFNIFYKNSPDIKVVHIPKMIEANPNMSEEDALNSIKQIFTAKYKENYKKNIGDLNSIINAKYYYFDTILWMRVNKSPSIKAYLDDLGVKGPYNLKIYMQQYLRNVDLSKLNSSDWHMYLKKCIDRL